MKEETIQSLKTALLLKYKACLEADILLAKEPNIFENMFLDDHRFCIKEWKDAEHKWRAALQQYQTERLKQQMASQNEYELSAVM
jgi:hypothetical protein